MCLLNPEEIHFNNMPKKLIYRIGNQTTEFGFEMAKTISYADFGSIFYEINEFSSFFKNKNTHEEKFLTSLLMAYDGVFEKRNIKAEDSEETLHDIGVNAIALTDYTDFIGRTMSEMIEYLKKGYLRRFIITFKETKTRKFKKFCIEEVENFNKQLTAIGDKIFDIFKKINNNVTYSISEEAFNLHQQYAEELCLYCNELEDDLLEIEINSRAYKALRLSAIYATLNHPEIFSITVDDMKQAISTVEYLSQEFKLFLKYKPKHEDVHDRIFEFLKDNLEQEFAKGRFTSKSSDFGISREKMSKNFDNFMETVGDMAENAGYTLIVRRNQRNNGNLYKLLKVEEEALSKNVLDIEDLMLQGEHSKMITNDELLGFNNTDNFPNITNITNITEDELAGE